MPLLINLRQLERKELTLSGELPAAELDIEGVDELIRVASPLEHELTAQKMDDGILVRGWWRVELECECGRCLKKFSQDIEFDDWATHLALEGDEPVTVTDDCVDLTPYLREDILLELPQRPLCRPDCPGLPKTAAVIAQTNAQSGQADVKKDAWAELNKLKF
ncbi:MAG: hypothetical protein RLZZ350_2639 [Verrucomicrobiota bacterium]|jgi:uncharacterized protein